MISAISLPGELTPISMVAHHAFCPRRAWLEAMGEDTDTHQMAVWIDEHRASDDPSASRPSRLRAIDVASDTLGVIGRCDTVEIGDDGSATVVEHKATPARRRAEVTELMVVQLALQAQALRESGFNATGAAVYPPSITPGWPCPSARRRSNWLAATSGGPRRYWPRIWHQSRLRTIRTAALPACGGLCLPDERILGPVHRRVLVADPDAQVLHLATPGSRVYIRSGGSR